MASLESLKTPVPRILSHEEVSRIAQRVLGFARDGGETTVYIQSWWNGELRWARNRTSLAGDRRDITVRVSRLSHNGVGNASTNQLDDVSLESIVRAAERGAVFALRRDIPSYPVTPPFLRTPETRIWSDQTYNVSVAQRALLVQTLTERAEQQSMLSAGYIEMRAGETAVRSTAAATPETIDYYPYTQAQCSTTVRHPKGAGAGWAGLSSYDWSAIDSGALATRALDKCIASLNPVAIEPGRYTVVLEPQAVNDLISPLFGGLNDRITAERGEGPFAWTIDTDFGIWRTKLGLKIADERITISHDPTDPLLGVVPLPGMQPITWINQGVLTTLAYDRTYALQQLNDNLGADARPAYRMTGGTTSIDEMILTTKRGLLVTRFSNLMLLDYSSMLFSGVTRDGLWLIENGKISKVVKNLRFTESPLFVLNQIDQLGVPVPVFRPMENPYVPGLSPGIVPPLKVNDFSFTATIDAI